MQPLKLIYHDRYDLNLGAHVFPSQKYRMIRDALLRERLAAPGDFLVPAPAADEDILRVHTADWVQKLKTGTLTLDEIAKLEVPYSPEMVEAVWLATGGTILAAHRAVEDGLAINIGGGFHHAFPGHGEGFCAIHDVAVAIRRLQADGTVRKAMVVDTDVHQGNGTASIFSHDDSVFTFSIHQEDNYPDPKPPSTLDLHLPDGIGDEEYLRIFSTPLRKALDEFRPDIVFYVGGADPYHEDMLGGLAMSLDGLERRDTLVFEEARRRNLPVAVTLAGGYARRVEDTIRIHVNTVLAARDVMKIYPCQPLPAEGAAPQGK
jgi:acetoin utilization deacetylase AcuC-like enzyme